MGGTPRPAGLALLPTLMLVGAFSGLLSSCTYSPDFASGTLLCGPARSCPKGYECRLDGTCWKRGETQRDGGFDRPILPDALPRDVNREVRPGLTNFVGLWTFTQGTLHIECSDMSVDNQPLGPTDAGPADYLVADVGVNADLIVSYYCRWDVNVAGGQTVVLPGQSCSSSSGGTNFTWSATSMTLSTQDGQTGTVTSTIAATYTDAMGPGTCTLQVNGSVRRSPL
jgi:hypothetical protein